MITDEQIMELLALDGIGEATTRACQTALDPTVNPVIRAVARAGCEHAYSALLELRRRRS